MQKLVFFGCAIVLASVASAAEPPRGDAAKLADKPLYKFTEAEVGAYLGHLQATEPNLRKRIVHLARKNLGQPYDIYLLGEMPFETYDPQPIYCLTKSDCVVFAEHTYAMALTGDWPAFMRMLQRIRYRDGQIGVATRNHYTEADWVKSNHWLVRDITRDIAGDRGVAFDERIDRAKFLKGRYGLTVDIPVEMHHDLYLPYTEIDRIADHLQDGDFVNVGPRRGEAGRLAGRRGVEERVCRARRLRRPRSGWHTPYDPFDTAARSARNRSPSTSPARPPSPPSRMRPASRGSSASSSSDWKTIHLRICASSMAQTPRALRCRSRMPASSGVSVCHDLAADSYLAAVAGAVE